jgi:antibiotic biosynthesis monooxygenase (ABM) superfamily enzyme
VSEIKQKLIDPSVTVTIARRVKPECRAEFEAFLTGVTNACGQFSGYLGSNIFRPVNADDPEYRIIFKFDRLSNLRLWESSAERQYWFEIAEPLTISLPQIQVLTGLETWFTLPGKPTITPPPRYKMALVSWLAVFPLITGISVVFQHFLGVLPLVLRVAFVTAIAVPTMTYLLMPQMTRLFAWWLYPVTEITLPTKDVVPAIADNSQAIPLPDLQSATLEEKQLISNFAE